MAKKSRQGKLRAATKKKVKTKVSELTITENLIAAMDRLTDRLNALQPILHSLAETKPAPEQPQPPAELPAFLGPVRQPGR
jgi:hypothetical protein